MVGVDSHDDFFESNGGGISDFAALDLDNNNNTAQFNNQNYLATKERKKPLYFQKENNSTRKCWRL
jgi:hypothetical protein